MRCAACSISSIQRSPDLDFAGMIRPATISVIMFRLVLVVVLVATVAIMIATRRLVLVGVVALFLELAVRVLAGLFPVRAGNGAVARWWSWEKAEKKQDGVHSKGTRVY